MSLLPEVERELLRVAGQPIAGGERAGGRMPRMPRMPRMHATTPERRLGRGLMLLAAPAAAVVVAIVFLANVHAGSHPGRVHSTRSTHARGSFPGAPRTQPGDWKGGGDLCPLARPNRYLPPRSGCISAVRVDVDGDGRPDLVIVYAHLTRREYDGEFTTTGFTLAVIRPRGGTVRTRLPASEDNATIVEYGNVNGVPGDELIIQISQISSGSAGVIYTFHDGRLIRLPILIGWGGDSGTKAGFACRAGHPPRLILRSFELGDGGEYGSWQVTTTVYAWHGATLRRIARGTTTHHGVPAAAQTSLGGGCGTVDRATAG